VSHTLRESKASGDSLTCLATAASSTAAAGSIGTGRGRQEGARM
jgi:hypothetical protein